MVTSPHDEHGPGGDQGDAEPVAGRKAFAQEDRCKQGDQDNAELAQVCQELMGQLVMITVY
jgi:hypothetical protein